MARYARLLVRLEGDGGVGSLVDLAGTVLFQRRAQVVEAALVVLGAGRGDLGAWVG